MTRMELFDPVMPKNRPQSIIWFERAYWLGFATLLLDEVVSLYSGGPTLGLSIVLEVAITLLLWYLIAVKAKDWARWLYIVLTAAAVVMMIVIMVQEKTVFVHSPWSFVSILAGAIAAGFLLRIDAMLWCAQSASTERS